MLKVEGVGRQFSPKFALRDISFSIDEAEVVGLVGAGGSGKSLLLKILGGVIAPEVGSVEYPFENGNIGFLFQEGALFDSMTVIENVAFPLLQRAKRAEREMCYRKAYDMLFSLGLSRATGKLPGELSGGMRRRVGIARALVAEPKLVLLDDPTGGLDPVTASVLMQLVKDLHKRYRPRIVMASHDIRRLIPNVDRIIAIFDGKLICNVRSVDILRDAPPRVIEFLKTRFCFSQQVANANGKLYHLQKGFL
ncbi:MAG: ATP-binding cassette domain-containing protein [Deltaproteobacteria bacterium]|nr:ATP-binding cassette domain-containing protein [Deltaproteobacteria bacterium]